MTPAQFRTATLTGSKRETLLKSSRCGRLEGRHGRDGQRSGKDLCVSGQDERTKPHRVSGRGLGRWRRRAGWRARRRTKEVSLSPRDPTDHHPSRNESTIADEQTQAEGSLTAPVAREDREGGRTGWRSTGRRATWCVELSGGTRKGGVSGWWVRVSFSLVSRTTS